MPSLYDLADHLLALRDTLEGAEPGSEEELQLADLADQVDLATREKVDGYCRLYRAVEADLRAAEAELERVMAVRAQHVRTLERLTWLADAAMTRLGATKLEGQLTKGIRRQANGGKLGVEVLVLPADLPEPYRRVIVRDPEVKADVDALRAALEAGDPAAVAVARLKERTTRVVFA